MRREGRAKDLSATLYIPQDFGTEMHVLSPLIHVSQCEQVASNDSAFTCFEKHPHVTDT
jgi:hypothetical protein